MMVRSTLLSHISHLEKPITKPYGSSVPKFYQGNAQSRRLIDVIAPLGSPDMPVFNQTAVIEHSSFLPSDAISTGLEPLVYFKVDFVTKVRFKLIGKPHAKDFTLSAEVPIGANTGQKFAKRGIQASAAPGNGWGRTQAAVMVVLTTISLIFMLTFVVPFLPEYSCRVTWSTALDVNSKNPSLTVDLSQPREGTLENLLMWAPNRKNDYRLKLDVSDDTPHIVVILFDEPATALVNCYAESIIEADDESLPAAIANVIGTTHVLEIKSHTYYEYGNFENFTCWKTNLTEGVKESIGSSTLDADADTQTPKLKRLIQHPSVPTPLKPSKEGKKDKWTLKILTLKLAVTLIRKKRSGTLVGDCDTASQY
uniref:Protein NDR1-like n=1 Tax=Tanacetum cinerariifolium TaxID=118510 RepID=A0A6L2N204_TANCI|nr:protein NDR1-like [Tanacetum cinerariifolium]